jgi:hypothetical protein
MNTMAVTEKFHLFLKPNYMEMVSLKLQLLCSLGERCDTQLAGGREPNKAGDDNRN